jgi:hypothetical protein
MPNDDSSSLGSDDDDTGLCPECCSDPRGFLAFSASKCNRCGAPMATVNLVQYTKKAARSVAAVLTSKEPLAASGVHTLAVANVPQALWRDWVAATGATQSILTPDGPFFLTTVIDLGKFLGLQQLNGLKNKVAAQKGYASNRHPPRATRVVPLFSVWLVCVCLRLLYSLPPMHCIVEDYS